MSHSDDDENFHDLDATKGIGEEMAYRSAIANRGGRRHQHRISEGISDWRVWKRRVDTVQRIASVVEKTVELKISGADARPRSIVATESARSSSSAVKIPREAGTKLNKFASQERERCAPSA